MPGRAETVPSVCSGARPEPFQVEYCYISITKTEGSTYWAYFCPQLNCTLFTVVEQEKGKICKPKWAQLVYICGFKNNKKKVLLLFLPSLSIPTLRHFMKRQAWHDLRLRFVISHSFVAGQLYSMLPVDKKNKTKLTTRN